MSITSNYSNYNFNNFQKTGNPDADVQTFADANNITLDEAKEILRAKYGDPVQPSSTSIFTTDSTSNTDTYTSSSQGPSYKTRAADDEVVAYANFHNCSYEEARAELAGMFGTPDGYDNA